MNPEKIYLTSDRSSWILVARNWLPSTPDDLASINAEKPTERHVIKIFDKLVEIPRYQQSYGQDYMFSGSVSKSKPMIPLIEDIKTLLEIDLKTWLPEERSDFNMCLVNWYDDGSQYIGPHSDDERQLVKNSLITSLSWGGTRNFVLSPKSDVDGINLKILVNDGDLIVMGGSCQKTHKHSVPKCGSADPRVSFTYRIFN